MRNFDFIKRHRQHTLAAIEPEFTRVRAEVPELARCQTSADAVRVLHRKSDDPVKVAVTEALLLQSRLGRSALSTVLLLGYLRMLEYILSLGGVFIEDVDLRESMLLEAFTEAVASYRGLLANPCSYLLRETRRRYRLAARRYLRDQARMEPVDMKDLDRRPAYLWEGRVDAERTSLGVRAGLAEASGELRAMLRSAVGDRMSPKDLELVEATILGGEDIASFMDRKFPGLTREERERTYGRLQRQRNRTVHTLRGLLASWREEVVQAAPALALGEAIPEARQMRTDDSVECDPRSYEAEDFDVDA